MPADFNHLAVNQLKPLAIIYRHLPAGVALHVLAVFPLLCMVCTLSRLASMHSVPAVCGSITIDASIDRPADRSRRPDQGAGVMSNRPKAESLNASSPIIVDGEN
jgi:hypothetical protein